MADSIYDPEIIDLDSLREALRVSEAEAAGVFVSIKDPVTGVWSEEVPLG